MATELSIQISQIIRREWNTDNFYIYDLFHNFAIHSVHFAIQEDYFACFIIIQYRICVDFRFQITYVYLLKMYVYADGSLTLTNASII